MRATSLRLFGTALVASITLALPSAAFAYCRTMTCSSSTQSCPRDANGCIASGHPIFWANKCIGFDMQQRASFRVDLDDATRVVEAAFNSWRTVTCPSGGSPSIAFYDMGPVVCDQVQYNSDQGNANIIVFRDGDWPHPEGLDNTLALTTVTFDLDTGEIFDADMEINGTNPLTLSTPPPPGGFDLQAIVTHEAGHFLGLAHSPDPGATMFATYREGTYATRVPSPDDVAGICAAYPPNRSVPACDATPRHGFSSACGSGSASGASSSWTSPGCSAGSAACRLGGRGGRGGVFDAAGAGLLWLSAMVRRARSVRQRRKIRHTEVERHRRILRPSDVPLQRLNRRP